MKNFKLIIFSLLLVTSTSCTDCFEEINTNPNKTLVGSISASNVFEPILYNSANNWLDDTWYYNDELMQFTAHTGGVTREEHRYYLDQGRDWGGFWNFYANYGKNVAHMYELAVKEGDKSLEAISLTFKVLFFSNMTDMFGSVPYDEAFSGRTVGGTLTPRFNTQKEIYEKMFEALEEANDIYATNPTFKKPAMDGMYAGSMAQWRKFNNSLYLRLLCRVSGRSEMNVGTKMSEILSNTSKYPIFTSNSDNATVKFTGVDPYISYFGTTTESGFTSSGRKLTQQLIKMTVITDQVSGNQTYVDPRLPIIGKKNPTASVNPYNIWIGTVSGCTPQEQSTVDRGTSWLNYTVFCRKDAPATYMDYAEVQFIFAEAALKGLISGGTTAAKQYYEQAVRASMQKWSAQGTYAVPAVSISDANITTFLASSLGSWDLATNKEELIGNQKYLALFWIGMEAYHEYRRTGYPILTIGAGTYNDHILPTRFGYPLITMSTNADNANAALEEMGGENDMKTPVWWSKQAIQSGL
jgi:hypothetical protein